MMTRTPEAAARLFLRAATAAELMTPEPVTIPVEATLTETVRLLVDRRLSAAPVVDGKGRPIGVVSRTDIVDHDREAVTFARPVPEYYSRGDLERAAGEPLPSGFQVEQVDRTRVREVMTPAVFAVGPETDTETVVRQMESLDVHRLFVVDRDGVLVGVITSMDIVRNLLP
jgi:CBS domain-containing protein